MQSKILALFVVKERRYEYTYVVDSKTHDKEDRPLLRRPELGIHSKRSK